MIAMFDGTDALSDENKCAIHMSFSSNANWPYDWYEFCAIDGYTFVPDDNFEQALIDLGYDDVLDNYVVTDSINGVTSLDVGEKEISDLTGIEDFIALTHLNCRTNALVGLDVSNNTLLTYLHVGSNQLTELDVSQNTELTILWVGFNSLDSLDVSTNSALIDLRCPGNELTSIDVSTNIALEHLDLWANQLTNLDVNNNTALTTLKASSNDIVALDVSANTVLTLLYGGNNDVATLDVSTNTALEVLSFGSNELAVLDVSANTALTYLACGGNDLTTLDVSNNTALTLLSCYTNDLTVLDVSANTGLTYLSCANNDLTSLDVSSNTALETFYSNGNQLMSLDVSANTALTELLCNNNQLTYLNMRNGVTDSLTTFNATNNPDLTCIETLDLDYATANWTYENGNIDEGVSFSEFCASVYVSTTGSDSTGDGSLENPFASIQRGINAITDGYGVLVAPGTYMENINFNGKNIEVLGEDRETTIIYGNQENIVVRFVTGEDSTALISGFTITNGSRGIACVNNSNPRIENNVITGNAYGGTANSGAKGAGIYVYASSPRIYNNVISNNSVFANENYGSLGGGLYIYYSDLSLCDNNSIVNNYSDTRGGGVYLHGPSSVSGVNNIVWGNDAPNGSQIYQENEATSYLSYGDIEGGWEGEGNIDLDPHFCAAFFGDYHLAEGSPCIGSGLDSANMGALGVGCEFAQFPEPEIMSVTDVPEDQGGRVYVEFSSSMFDHPEATNQSYSLFRYDYFNSDTSGWVALTSVDAIGDPTYTFEAATLMDSTAEGDGMTEFKVVAAMNEGNFHSDPAMGYSTDDIAPSVPEGLLAELVDDGIQLTWEMSADEDFQYFMLEKSADEAFTEPEVFEMIDILYLDLDYVLNESNYYRLAAVDHAGNISDYSDVLDFTVLAIDLDLIPDVFALHQNYPNPFNPTTQIKYDLPEDAMVSIIIYDVMGRSIKSLVNTTQSAGYRSIQWDATNNLGEPVSAGMYIYMIQAGQFTKTKKMVLLK
jgi:hypothetical protein